MRDRPFSFRQRPARGRPRVHVSERRVAAAGPDPWRVSRTTPAPLLAVARRIERRRENRRPGLRRLARRRRLLPPRHEAFGNPVRAHIGAQRTRRLGGPGGPARKPNLRALRRAKSRNSGGRVGPDYKSWAIPGPGPAIGRVLSSWSRYGPLPRPFAGFSSAPAVGIGGTGRQGAIGSPDQGLDPDFWHRQRDSSWHNELCREMVHSTKPAGGRGTAPGRACGGRTASR